MPVTQAQRGVQPSGPSPSQRPLYDASYYERMEILDDPTVSLAEKAECLKVNPQREAAKYHFPGISFGLLFGAATTVSSLTIGEWVLNALKMGHNGAAKFLVSLGSVAAGIGLGMLEARAFIQRPKQYAQLQNARINEAYSAYQERKQRVFEQARTQYEFIQQQLAFQREKAPAQSTPTKNRIQMK